MEAGGMTCAAAQVVAAIEVVRFWIERGIPVREHTWVDVGGSRIGHYAIALALLGARGVTLLEPKPPTRWSRPLLSAAGVRVITAPAKGHTLPGVSAALRLYVPDCSDQETMALSSKIALLITNEDRVPGGVHSWTTTPLRDPNAHFLIGEGMSCPRGSASTPEEYLHSARMPSPEDNQRPSSEEGHCPFCGVPRSNNQSLCPCFQSGEASTIPEHPDIDAPAEWPNDDDIPF